MDIEGGEKKLNQVDSFLTTLTKVLKKHWLILLLIGFCAFIYWAFNLPDEKPQEQALTDVWTFELGEQGDTIWYLNDTIYENK